MINDLKVDALTWKYVDDTTISQTIPRGSSGDVQSAVSAVEAWSQKNKMELKANKRIYFIVLLKRANVPCSDIINFYCTANIYI